jgi:integrase
MTAIGLGLRSGELLALRWSDVDMEAATLAVRHTRNVRTGELAEPKTERSRRTLRLGAELAAALREHRRRQLEERLAAGSRWQDGDYVFATPLGRSLDANNVRHRFQATLVAAGLPRQRLQIFGIPARRFGSGRVRSWRSCRESSAMPASPRRPTYTAT